MRMHTASLPAQPDVRKVNRRLGPKPPRTPRIRLLIPGTKNAHNISFWLIFPRFPCNFPITISPIPLRLKMNVPLTLRNIDIARPEFRHCLCRRHATVEYRRLPDLQHGDMPVSIAIGIYGELLDLEDEFRGETAETWRGFEGRGVGDGEELLFCSCRVCCC